jgi:hypothetical protein
MGNETVGESVFFPGRKHPISGARDKQKRDTEDTQKREHTEKRTQRKEITEERSKKRQET